MANDPVVKGPKPVIWIGSTRSILRRFPRVVRQVVGQALFDAQCGVKHSDVKPLNGFGGAGVLEIAESFDGNAYRAIYTVRFARAIYVLHVFQKKSKRGIRTPAAEIATLKARLQAAEKHYDEWLATEEQDD